MRAEQLSDSMDLLANRLLEEAEALRSEAGRKKPRRWQAWAALAACLCLLAVGAVAVSSRGGGSGTADSGGDSCGTLPGGIAPELLVDGRVFHWSGMSRVVSGLPETYLPEGYAEYGPVTSVTAEPPTEDGQMMAGFDAAGTIYTSEATPEVVYVLMTTDWFSDAYVRFVSDELAAGARIAWQGSYYRIEPAVTPDSERVQELPEGCEQIGVLDFIGEDAVPRNDLETNCANDRYGYSLEGRAVFRQPGGPDILYVYQKHYWREGEYDEYLVCPLWPDGGDA